MTGTEEQAVSSGTLPASKSSSRRQLPYILSTIAGGSCWGVISLFLKPLASSGLSSLQIMFVRAVISALVMFFIILIKDRALFKFSPRDIWIFLGSGVVSLTFFSICYFRTILTLGTSVAVVLLYTSPIFVMFFALILFKEKLTARKLIALAVTFAGCILVAGLAGGASKITLGGFLIGIGAGLGYALYSVFSRFALRKYHIFTLVFYTFIFSALSLIPFVHITQIPSALAEPRTVLLSLGISIISTVLPYVFYTVGLSGLETGKAAVLATVEPLVGTLIGFFVWKEDVSVLKVIGIILIFAAVILLGLPDKKKTDEN